MIAWIEQGILRWLRAVAPDDDWPDTVVGDLRALLVAFAAGGLALAVIGVYGVTALAVTQRRQEFGIRVALGATRGAISSLVLKQAVTMVIVGVAAGAVGAAVLSRFIAGLLFETPAGDVASFAAGAGALGVAAVLATVMPIRRATTSSPTSVLRAD